MSFFRECIKFNWQNSVFGEFDESFFLGGWHPSAILNVDVKGFGNCKEPSVFIGKNYFLISNKHDDNDKNSKLFHNSDALDGREHDVILFSGYLLDAGIHSFSPSEDILNYFNTEKNPNYNGVFSLVRISEAGKKIEIRSDAFGISPLYYRIYKKMILFSSSPRFLRFDDDAPDYIAWRCLIQSRSISSDRTLSMEVKRFPAGSIMYNDGDDYKKSSWFDFSNLPNGEISLDEIAIDSIERSFRAAIDKCLKLDDKKIFLPLSSGHDSRRILSVFGDLNVDFESATVKVYQKGYRDLDAKFASLMASDFGFKHKVVELPPLSDYVKNDIIRRVVLDAESSLHTWYVSLLSALPKRSSIVFDGLAGDVWGETGFEIPEFHHGDRNKKIKQIASHLINDSFDDVFNLKNMPTANDVREDICSYIRDIPDSLFFSDIAFLLLRTRRSISIGVQQLLPVGHMVVFPYLDLDYVKTTLRYSPIDKLKRSVQSRCLEKYSKKYYSYGGSRDFPDEIPSDGLDLYKSQLYGRFSRLRKEVLSQGGFGLLSSLLGKKSALIFLGSFINEKFLYGREWYLMGLLELVSRQTRRVSYLDVKGLTEE